MATTADLTIEQGATFIQPLIFQRLTNPTLPYNASTNPYIALDLTDCVVRMMVRADYDSTQFVLSLSSVGTGIVITNAAAGLAEIRVTPAMTTWTGTTGVRVKGESFEGVYDIEVDDGLTVARAFSGACTITREVTR